MIPLINLKEHFEAIKDELLDEISEVLLSGQYILGPKVAELEQAIAKKLGVTEAIGVGNGTDALILTLDAFGIGKGDQVITSPFTFFATAEAITRVGATPVFVDVDPDTYCISPEKIKEKINEKTKAIIPVHLFGQSADMDTINAIANEHQLFVIEDACQAFGATYKGKPVGSLGHAACFSFFPTKNLGTMGDGGIVTTSDEGLAKKLRQLRIHGSEKKYFHNHIGYNSRLDEIHAAILLVGLQKIDTWNNQRIASANRYEAMLKDEKHIILPRVSHGNVHVYHLYCVKSSNRKEILKQLTNEKIQTGVYYPRCLHLQEAFKNLGYQQGDLPIAEDLSEKLLAIPMYPSMSEDHQSRVITALRRRESLDLC